MGGAFFKLYYEGQVSPWLFVSTALAVVVLLFAWWANSHLYRAPNAEVIPEFETPTLPRRHARQPTPRPVPCRSYSPKR